MRAFTGKYFYKLKFLVILLLITTLSACIGIPVPGYPQQPVYSEELLQTIELESSTKTDVRTALGAPDLIRLNGKLWIYGWSQYHGRFGGLALIPPVPVPVYGSLYNSYHTLFYEFDTNNVLQKSQYLKGVIPCRDDGICVTDWRDTREIDEEILLTKMPWEFDVNQRFRLTEDYSVVKAPENWDRRAKELKPVPNQCGVYISNEGHRDIFLAIAELTDKPVSHNTYAFVELEPGTHRLEIRYYSSSVESKNRYFADSHEFSCSKEELIFFQVLRRKKPIEKIETLSERSEALEDKRLVLIH